MRWRSWLSDAAYRVEAVASEDAKERKLGVGSVDCWRGRRRERRVQ